VQVTSEDRAVALVTGAAGGIGAAVARELSRAGWAVAGIDLYPSVTDLSWSVDVTDGPALERAVREIEDDLGPVTTLVTAAGHYEMLPFDQIAEVAWNRMLHVHLGGAVNAIRAVLPGMRRRAQGCIVAVTSELAIGGGSGDAHYAAAKGAVIGLVRALAAELGPEGIRVNSVAPGPTDTPLLAPDSPWRAPSYLATLPVGRLAQPEEIAIAVRYVAEEGSFLGGEVVSVNSGTVL
jgi:2-hydroxycyclohexanecarboxyl-CoA dehydrogenase